MPTRSKRDRELAEIAERVRRIADPLAFELLCWLWHERDDLHFREMAELAGAPLGRHPRELE